MAIGEAKFLGCLLGSAIGEALGAVRMGLSREEMVGLPPLRGFAPAIQARSLLLPPGELGETEVGDRLLPGQWADGTQLTLGMAEALIEEGGVFVPEAWAYKLTRWLNAEPRAPGLSTLQAAMQLRAGSLWDEVADPEGAGCGPATRVAPIGLRFAEDPQRRQWAAVLQAQMTHGHPDAAAAALAVAEAVALAAATPPELLATFDGATFLATLAERVRAASPDYVEFARCLELARRLLEDRVETEAAVRALGFSAWSREAVPSALYCVAACPGDLETLLLTVVNQSAEAVNNIAGIAGAVGGAMRGVSALPARWIAEVEETARIAQVASALYALYAGQEAAGIVPNS